jgi:small ligand-binding sensory domain FIST
VINLSFNATCACGKNWQSVADQCLQNLGNEPTTACEDMMRMLTDLRKRANGPIKGGVYYTCLGRGRNQFGEDSKELKLIQEQRGNFPLVGFFAYGEIAHNRVYGYTGVLTLFL